MGRGVVFCLACALVQSNLVDGKSFMQMELSWIIISEVYNISVFERQEINAFKLSTCHDPKSLSAYVHTKISSLPSCICIITAKTTLNALSWPALPFP